MAGYHILIVDDHREVSRVLRSGLESLGHDMEVDDALSGEEAIVEITRGPVDLLVADVRLPGISGLELMEKYKALNPAMKIFLITGLTDPKVRQKVAQAGADAFFFKPIDMPEFLDAAEHALGLKEVRPPFEPLPEEELLLEEEIPFIGMSERIAGLRRELDAIAVFLVDDRGKTIAQAGNLPDPEIENELRSVMVSAFNTGTHMSRSLGLKIPENLMWFRGLDFDLFLSQVGDAHALAIANPSKPSAEIDTIANAAHATAHEVLTILADLGVSPPLPEQPMEADAEPEPEEIADKQIDTELVGIIEDADTQSFEKKDVDAFWDTLAEKGTSSGVTSGDALSYDQALQLGLAPED
jgi:CheY-like chemotaxis protein